MDLTAVCKYCEERYEVADSTIDDSELGFWCDSCDGFTYWSNKQDQTHKFTLILEDKSNENPVQCLTNKHLQKRLSPLRYPGGKSKFIEYILSKTQDHNMKTFVGAYAGGASVELSLLQAGLIEELILNDYDYGIYSLFTIIKESPNDLLYKIQTNLKPTHDDFFKARETIKSNYNQCSQFEAAWALLLTNRLAYSGIVKANPLGGRTGSTKSLLSRWNPVDLCNRIELIHNMSDRISVFNLDAVELIEEYYWHPNTTILVDPPYFKKGKQLYNCFYEKDDHIKLRVCLDYLHQGFSGADVVLTYDNDTFIEWLYDYPTEVEKVNRIYSI